MTGRVYFYILRIKYTDKIICNMVNIWKYLTILGTSEK